MNIKNVSAKGKSIIFLSKVVVEDAERVYNTIMDADPLDEVGLYATFCEACEDMGCMTVKHFIDVFL